MLSVRAQAPGFPAYTASVLLVQLGPMRTLPVSVKALLLIGLTLIAYLPALHNGLIWDDDAWLMKNQTLFGWSGLHKLWFNPLALQQYYPITGTVFWILGYGGSIRSVIMPSTSCSTR